MSYADSTTLASKRLGQYEIILSAGSYDPGNQPSYGRDWEYFHVTVYVGKFGDPVIEKTFDTKKEAKHFYEVMLERYKE
jgi:hypothetical protein